MKTEFACDRNSLSQADTFSGVPHLNVVRESISKIKNGKAAGPPSIVSEMVKTRGKAEVDIITDLVNQIIGEGILPAEWQLSIFVTAIMGKAIL